jgi:type I restriction enzyme S subunit
MSFPRYPAYKPSGVEWLGEVPEHWQEKPLKTITSINDEVLPESLSRDYEIEYVDIGSVSLANGIEKTEAMLFGDAPSRARRIPRDGDVLVSTVRTYLKAIAPVVNPPSNLVASTGFAVVRPRHELEPGFLKYALQEEHFIQQVISRSTGVSYPAINASDVAKISLNLPGSSEQLAITTFLDHETTKIDALIAEQQRLIELLQEKRQAVISHAVTKGLNPHAPMKDSGVEWLGEVPEHWTIKQVRHLLKSLSQGSSPNCLPDPAQVDEYGVLKVGCVNGMAFLPSENKALPAESQPDLASLIQQGDVLMSRGNTRELVGLAALVTESSDRLMASDLIFILKVWPDNVDPGFLVLSLRSGLTRSQIEQKTVGTSASMQKINQSTIKEIVLPIPPLAEQALILKNIQEEVRQTEEGIGNSREAIALLQERRSALISAAVTGQIDVRGLVPVAEAA